MKGAAPILRQVATKVLSVVAVRKIVSTMVSIACGTASARKPGPMMVPTDASSLGLPPSVNLVELSAFLVDAENADIAGVVMPAGIDAARHIETQRPDLLLALRVFEALGDLLGDRDRAGIGEIAIVEAGAADHVAQEIVIAGGKPVRGEDVIDRDHVGRATWGSIRFCV